MELKNYAVYRLEFVEDVRSVGKDQDGYECEESYGWKARAKECVGTALVPSKSAAVHCFGRRDRFCACVIPEGPETPLYSDQEEEEAYLEAREYQAFLNGAEVLW